ncbi:MAG: class I SAM-dependent methyltransferase [Patescibacteria group bacterium]
MLNPYQKLARYYDTDKAPVWQEVKDLLSDIKSGIAVLDIGCGTGRVRQALPADLDYTGLDNSPELLEVARRKYANNKFVQADARDLPLPDNSFDAVLLIATIHHFFDKADRLKVLQEARRVLKPGGQIYLTVWNLNRPKFWHNWRGWRKVYIPNQHDTKIIRQYYTYTLLGLKKELKAVGFNIAQIGYNKGSWLKSRNIVVKAEK